MFILKKALHTGRKERQMVFDRELNFFCDTLKKLHVNYSVVTPSESVSSVVDPNLLPLLSNVLDINDGL